MLQCKIQPQIISIEEFKIPDVHSDYTYVYKLVTSKLEITINSSKWTIPVQYIFSKNKKPIFSQGTNGYLQSKSVDAFYKMRIINQPLFELQTSTDFSELIHLLLCFDSNYFNEISSAEFDKISIEDLLFKDDMLDINDINQIDCEVRLYPNTAKIKDAVIRDENQWSIPYVRLSDFDFADEMIEQFTYPKQICNINIVPKNYRCSFRKLITSESEMLRATMLCRPKYHVLFKGKYEECRNFFNEKKGLIRIANSELIKHIKSPKADAYNDSDYFDAMTDGQLGDYDTFTENGGNIDDIDTWSGG
jgi:hypothetical protein